MRDDTPSRTALWVAAARGLGMLLPPEARIAEDRYGTLFASPTLAKLLERPGARPLAQIPGLKSWIVYMQVRTRVIDDAVRAFVADGGDQLVVLGAGYDTRALRMPELAGTAVFEIDHPATQAHKRTVLGRAGVDSPAHYVTWDFESRPLDELAEELVAAGHDPTRPTFTIWEGVTMYLTEGAIDASLRAIADWSAPGSRLAMTYFAKSRMERPSLVTRAAQVVVSRLGEPFKFGWQPEELPGYLADRGFTLAQDIAMRDAASELLPASLAASVQSADRRIALAIAQESIAVAHC